MAAVMFEVVSVLNADAPLSKKGKERKKLKPL